MCIPQRTHPTPPNVNTLNTNACLWGRVPRRGWIFTADKKLPPKDVPTAAEEHSSHADSQASPSYADVMKPASRTVAKHALQWAHVPLLSTTHRQHCQIKELPQDTNLYVLHINGLKAVIRHVSSRRFVLKCVIHTASPPCFSHAFMFHKMCSLYCNVSTTYTCAAPPP